MATVNMLSGKAKNLLPLRNNKKPINGAFVIPFNFIISFLLNKAANCNYEQGI